MDELSMKTEIEALKRENQFYKNFISQLPNSVYEDSNHDYQMRKKEKRLTVKENAHLEAAGGQEREKDLFGIMVEQFSDILNFIRHHVVIINQNGIVTFCNLQAAKDLNVDQAYIIGRHVRELLKLPDDKIMLLQTIETGKEFQNEEVLDRNYGIVSTKIIYNPDGSIKRVIGIMEFLNRLKDAEKQAHAGRIAAGIAHEIRNPLTTVRGYLQFLQEQVDTEISELFNSLLIPEIDRANTIITDFLRLAKPMSEQHQEYFEVGVFFNEYLMNFLEGGAFLDKGNIHLELSPESLSCVLLGNKHDLVQVFINLYRNSLEAIGNKSLTINIKVKVIDKCILVTFSDNGYGIAPSTLANVFDPFFTTKDEGTGLGLSLSKKIIENHKGMIEVESSEKGTVFTIFLPILYGENHKSKHM